MTTLRMRVAGMRIQAYLMMQFMIYVDVGPHLLLLLLALMLPLLMVFDSISL